MSDWRDYRVLIAKGTRDTKIKCPGALYRTMTLGEIFAMGPQRVDKERALGMIPSTYADHDGREHEVQQERGQYVALVMDIDSGARQLQEIVAMARDFTGAEVAYRVFSTASATVDAPRWRVIVPLEDPLAPQDWHRACEAFYCFAQGRGIATDSSQDRWAQLAFLPNVPPDKRAPDGSPLFYQTEAFNGSRGLRLTDPGLAGLEEGKSAPQPPDDGQSPEQSPSIAAALRRAACPTLAGPIRRFNDTHRIEDLLVKYGYTGKGTGPHWRSPHQTSDSFATMVAAGDDGKQYWVSLSASDAAAGLGRETAGGARFGDAFDLCVHYEHGDDRNAALASLKVSDVAEYAAIAEAAVDAAEAGDKAAPFAPEPLQAFVVLRDSDPHAWMRLRERLKKARVGLGELDRAMRLHDDRPHDEEATVADRLIELARERCRFVRDDQGNPYAVFESDGARQIYGVGSEGFSDFLSHAFYAAHDRAPGEQAVRVALQTLRGQAKFEGEACEVYIRVAKTDGAYWLDLCDDAWRCVQITATGWAVVAGDGAPLFTRSPSMRPLPVPEQGGTLDALWPLVNIPQAARPMVLAWLLECLRPDIPHPVLELVGEQGSAKSFTQKFLRRLIDPNQADLRPPPKAVEDIWIAAHNGHLVSLENVSYLSAQVQDALCMVATGGGYAGRKLYTNGEEAVLTVCNPTILNGISVNVTAQDLLDRTIHLELPPIESRELAGEMEERFQVVHPSLLGALLDLFVKVLAALPSVSIPLQQRPRMADFVTLGEAVSRVVGRPEGAFLAEYLAMREDSILTTLDGSPVAVALLAFLERSASRCYTGSLTDLLQILGEFRQTSEAWPRSAKGLGDALRRLAPALRMRGCECKALPKRGGVIRWHISLSADPATPNVEAPAGPVGVVLPQPLPEEAAPAAFH
jgi:hypothetical protein